MTRTNRDTGAVEVPIPQNLLAEQAVIGSLLLDREAIVHVAPYLRPEDFHTESLGTVYRAVLVMYQRRVPCDPVTLWAELESMGALASGDEPGGVRLADLMDVTARTPTASHVQYYANLVVEAAARRALITAGGSIAAMGYEKREAVQDVMQRAQAALAGVYQARRQDQEQGMDHLAEEHLAYLEGLQLGMGDDDPRVVTGYPTLDGQLGGMRPGNLVIIAARPSVGKTALALNVAYRAALAGKRVLLFSLEMQADELTTRLCSLRCGIAASRLARGTDLSREEWERVTDALGLVSGLPLRIDDTSGLAIGDLKARAERVKIEHGVDVVIVDYLQLVRGTPRKDGNRVQEVGEVARELKNLAKDMGCPVVACCQVNRGPEERKDKAPQLSDLRESGEIEQAADIVLMLHREEVYDPACTRPGMCEVYIRKHRNGPTGVLTLFFKGECMRFEELDWRDDRP